MRLVEQISDRVDLLVVENCERQSYYSFVYDLSAQKLRTLLKGWNKKKYEFFFQS